MSSDVVIGLDGLDAIIKAVKARGYRAMGPVVRDGAIALGEVEGVGEMPAGWHDEQGPGSYNLAHDGSPQLFGWAVGPHSPKSEVFPPRSVIWRAKPPTFDVEEVADDALPLAVIGVRPCDIAALKVLDQALDSPNARDPIYRARRRKAFLAVVECTRPARTCFCVSMGTGPGISRGFDLGLTELAGDGAASAGPRYLVRTGSHLGRDVLAGVPQQPATEPERAERVALLARAGSHMGRSVDTSGLPDLLAHNLANSRWAEVANRCLACGNCTAVCPTCFCSNFEDTTDLSGTVERHRSWASCSDLAYSYIHGGPVRSSIKSRYRQWATHKFSWWWDQFGTSGCVGCGRCITWCPAGIDITEELAALRASDGNGAPLKG
ncbi:MAG TPA: 4Fe-4S dicluster domain-containing protein [Acidimicrobiales bacterium]|nr:4Fe-4S dicluster domain-containing protein [Acidimicrobiales bacterium]